MKGKIVSTVYAEVAFNHLERVFEGGNAGIP